MEKTNRRVYLRLTNACNRQCKFCCFSGDPKVVGEMSVGTVQDIINRELAMHVEDKYLRVVLTGGEPTLCKNLKEIINELRQHHIIRIVLETNGSMLDSEEFKDLLPNFIHKHFIKLALHSDAIDNDPETIQKIIEFTKMAKESGIRYLLNVRYYDETDKERLRSFIEEHELKPDFGEVYYYPIHSLNLYRDGTLPEYGIPYITYDYDGQVLIWSDGKTQDYCHSV